MRLPWGLSEIINSLEKEVEATLLDALREADSIDSGDWRNRQAARGKTRDINRQLRNQTMLENSERLKQLVSNWLVPFLKVWAGIEQGAMRFKRGVLNITTRDRRHAEIAKSMRFNVYLDTTGDRNYLAQYLDIAPGSIVQIEQTPADFTNLRIVQITGIGKGGKERSDTLKGRIEALHTTLKKQHPDAALLDHKVHAENHEAAGWWFNHNRATNQFEHRSTLIATGTPYQDIGALQSEYIALTGDSNIERDSPGFAAFVDWKVESEIAQAPGRLRAHRRQEEQLICYLINDLDLDFLKQYYPGATLETVDIGTICPEAADPAKKSFETIKRCLEDWWQKHGALPTQVEVASQTGIDQSWISRLCNAFVGGWKTLKKIVHDLVTTREDCEEFDDDDKLCATYLPLLAEENDGLAIAETLAWIVRDLGWHRWRQIVAYTPYKVRLLLVSAMFTPALLTEAG